MLISAKVIKRPRQLRYCETCKASIEGPTLRLYGSAEVGDPLYVIYLHPGCTEWKDPKILKAKEAITIKGG